ncbi:MAG: hypothetical protein D3908_01505 [Candidatus Electrothrix sp. AUS4]|nr:hypothetical protein [Candidatus Electrothrix sp. AUS4]
MSTSQKKNLLSEIGVWFENNKPFAGKITYASLFFTYLVGIPAWPAISSIFGIDKDLGLSIFIGVFVIHLGMIFSVLIDIYDRGRTPETWFSSHQDSLPAFRAELDNTLKERPTSIIWLGVSMQSAWLALENVFTKIHEGQLSDVKIILLPIHPEFCKALPGNNDGLASVTQGQMEYMDKRCLAMNDALRTTGCEIIIAQYFHMPNFHGVLLGENRLFISTVRWHGDLLEEMSVPREPYELIDNSTPRGRYYVKLFRSWVGKCTASANEHDTIFKYPREDEGYSSD